MEESNLPANWHVLVEPHYYYRQQRSAAQSCGLAVEPADLSAALVEAEVEHAHRRCHPPREVLVESHHN